MNEHRGGVVLAELVATLTAGCDLLDFLHSVTERCVDLLGVFRERPDATSTVVSTIGRAMADLAAIALLAGVPSVGDVPPLDRLRSRAVPERVDERFAPLGDVDLRILRMISTGEAADVVARRLDLSLPQITRRLVAVRAQLGVDSTGAAVRSVRRAGLL